LKGNDILAILRQENMLLCKTGASTHVRWSKKGSRNVQDTMMYNLGHADSAMESNAFINIPGVFVNKGREAGLQAVLKDCSFSEKHHFKLVSMSKLMHKQGWKIVCGNETFICIENKRVMSSNLILLCLQKMGQYMLTNLSIP
jgi:hypothetical protein